MEEISSTDVDGSHGSRTGGLRQFRRRGGSDHGGPDYSSRSDYGSGRKRGDEGSRDSDGSTDTGTGDDPVFLVGRRLQT